MKKPLLLLLTCLLSTIAARAQDFAYGAATPEELNMKNYNNDTSAHAVVLNEYGTSIITPTNAGEIRLVYQYHVKIKIFDKDGITHGNIELPYYIGDQITEQLDYISGVTTYLDDNGAVKTVELDPSQIFTVKKDKHNYVIKFAMPAVRSDCVIEFKYRLETPYIMGFHPWEFQSDMPKVYSEYEVHIPAFWNFNASMRGKLKLTKNTSGVEKDCFVMGSIKCDCSHFIYGMSNIPAFVEEADMTSPNNYKSAIYYQLSDYTDLNTGADIKVTKEWKDIDYELKHGDYFGQQIRKKGLFTDKIPPVIAGKTDTLAKAEAIYAWLQKWMKWDDADDYGSADGIRKALDGHTGNAADINIALIAALNAAGINADGVLLSTRANGFINKLYPSTSDFNYVVARVVIGNKPYLLDATDPLMPFGMLPLRCLNDQGRVMSLDKPSYWIDMNTNQRESSTYQLNLTLQPDGKITGSLTHYSIGYRAYEKRKAIKKFNTVDEYVEDVADKMNIKIIKSDIGNLDSLDQPLSERYEIEYKKYSSLDHDRISFNPKIFEKTTVNPFKAADRTYPVDWGMPSTDRYVITLHLPDNFVIADSLKNYGIGLPNNGGSFITNFEGGNNSFTFSSVTQFNKSIYSSEEYPYLKELYNKIILSEKGEVILRKKTL